MDYEFPNKMMDEYYFKLVNLYNRANTKSKMNKVCLSLASFSDIYKKIHPDTVLAWEEDDLFNHTYLDIENVSFDRFMNNLYSNKDKYNDIFNHVINDYIDVKYPFYKYNSINYDESLQRVSKRELIDIMYSFLDSYDNSLYLDFKNIINDNQLFYDFDVSMYDGYTTNIECLNKTFIFVNGGILSNLHLAKVIMHEFGHAYENKINYDHWTNFNSFDTPFYEVSSSFFEYAFLNYVKDNKIFGHDAFKCLDYYYKELFLGSLDMNVVSKYLECCDEEETDEDFFVPVCDEKLWNEVNVIKEKVNFYGASDQEDYLSLVNSYIYPIGQLFSIYLYESYKLDKNNFKKEFANSLYKYSIGNSVQNFENLGISYDALVNSDTLKKVLKKYSGVL